MCNYALLHGLRPERLGKNITKHRWYYHRCVACGAMVLSHSPNRQAVLCNKCEKLNHAKPVIKRSARLAMADPESFFVEEDPVPLWDGGFRKGTPITQIQAIYMCTYGSFSSGTILSDRQQRRFQVRARQDGKQEIIRLTS